MERQTVRDAHVAVKDAVDLLGALKRVGLHGGLAVAIARAWTKTVGITALGWCSMHESEYEHPTKAHRRYRSASALLHLSRQNGPVQLR
jgi:hypothetical protein